MVRVFQHRHDERQPGAKTGKLAGKGRLGVQPILDGTAGPAHSGMAAAFKYPAGFAIVNAHQPGDEEHAHFPGIGHRAEFFGGFQGSDARPEFTRHFAEDGGNPGIAGGQALIPDMNPIHA